MTQQHPITPPPELVQQWWDDFNGAFYEFEAITATVFQAGADQELEACCEWLCRSGHQFAETYVAYLRAARRPKPPSLKEQAMDALNVIEDKMLGPTTEEKLIRRALEALPD
jgi:hypothetical protein